MKTQKTFALELNKLGQQAKRVSCSSALEDSMKMGVPRIRSNSTERQDASKEVQGPRLLGIRREP